jgi:hypothetical protein
VAGVGGVQKTSLFLGLIHSGAEIGVFFQLLRVFYPEFPKISLKL